MAEPLRILILEDNPAYAELVQFELEEAGFTFTAKVVTTKKDYILGLQEFTPDLILSDYDLPAYNGSLALAEAKRRCPDTPFILVTGAVSEDRAIEILTQGAKDYVLKTRLQQRLIPAIQRALDEVKEHKERKKAEADLQAASLYSRTLLEVSLDPLVTISSEGKVMDVNRATEQITGVSRERLIGTDFSNYFTQPQKARLGYEKAFSEGSVQHYPLAIRHTTGRITDVLYNATVYRNEKGEVQGVFAAARDITELKKTEEELRETHRTLEERVKIRTAELEAEMVERNRVEEALRESDERQRFALETSHIGAWDLDLVDHTAFRTLEHDRIFGYSALLPQWTYEMFLDHILPEDRIEVERQFRHAIENQSDWNFECRIRRIDDEIRWIWAAGRHRLDANGKVRKMAGVVQDITERKKVEMALAEQSRQLKEVNGELESFSYSVSHDLRAPLRAIDGFSRILARDYGNGIDEKFARAINAIRDNAKIMGNLIDDLLSFSKAQKAQMIASEIDMDKLVKEIWDHLQDTVNQRELDLRIGEILPAYGDPALIRQVLFNLISNAAKFTKNRKPGIIEISSHSEPDRIVYSVKDNGAGFAMEYYHKLFGVFQRLHSQEEYEGTGIGLAIVQRIVKRHGGDVWAQGAVNEGSAFYFSLPLRTG